MAIENIPTEYDLIMESIKNWYGEGSDVWAQMTSGGLTNAEWAKLANEVPEVTVNTTFSGKIKGYSYNYQFSKPTTNVGEVINSNLQEAEYGVANSFKSNVPMTAEVSAETGKITASRGARLLSTNIPVDTVFQKLSVGAGAVMAGCRLGAFIDSAIYNYNPAYWDEKAPSINPETWLDIAGNNKFGRSALSFLFGVDDNNNATAYMDENAFAYMAYMMSQEGFFNSEIKVFPPIDYVSPNLQGDVYITKSALYIETETEHYRHRYWLPSLEDIGGFWCFPFLKGGGYYDYITYMNDTSEVEFTWVFQETEYGKTTWKEPLNRHVSGITSTFRSLETNVSKKRIYFSQIDRIPNYYIWNIQPLQPTYSYNGANNVQLADLFTLIYDGSIVISSDVDGVSQQPNIEPPNTQTWLDPQSTLDSLKQLYPDWWNNAVYTDVPQPDGTTERVTYIPMPTTPTDSAYDTQPTNTTVTQDETTVDPTVTPDNILKTIIQYITDTSTENPTPTDNENPPDTGSGETPVVVLPTGHASSLWAIYNPTQEEVNAFGAWLWDSDFIEQLKKLFNDPMQAILGIHKVFAPPVISGTGTIKCGYIDSGVSSKLVGSQYTTVDCGTVSLREYFGNVFDYAPYTEIRIFLPFIGVVQLDVADVMRSSINVKYHVDVITGACLAEVSVRRDASGGIIYTYGGSCIVSYPVSSGSYMGIVTGALSTVGSAIGTVGSFMSGNPLGGAIGIASTAHSLANMHTNVQHSGGFTGASACMGGKKPYLIISRPQTVVANNVEHFQGLPSNYTTPLSACSGYVRVLSCHVENIAVASAEEKLEIERLLKSGVLIQ